MAPATPRLIITGYAAVFLLLALAAVTSDLPLALTCAVALVLLTLMAAAIRTTDRPQTPLDPDPFEPADSDGFAQRVAGPTDGSFLPERYRNSDLGGI